MSRPKKGIKYRKTQMKNINKEIEINTEEKQKRDAKSLATRNLHRISKNIRQPQYRKVESLHMVHMLRHIIDHTRPLMICTHTLVGSSMVIALLKGELDFPSTHTYISSTLNRRRGKIAENIAGLKLKTRGTCKGSNILPFICATPDFIEGDRLIEIKSLSCPGITKYTVMQVLVSMEIYGFQKAEIHIYKSLKGRGGVINPRASLHTIVGIDKTGTLFTDEFIEKACRGYVTYLYQLFNFLKIETPISCAEDCFNLLVNHAHKSSRGNWDVGPYDLTHFCFLISRFFRWTPVCDFINIESIFNPIGKKQSFLNVNDYIEKNPQLNTYITNETDETKPKCILSEMYSQYSKSPITDTKDSLKKFFKFMDPADPSKAKQDPFLERILPVPVRKVAYLYDQQTINKFLTKVAQISRYGKEIKNFDFLNL